MLEDAIQTHLHTLRIFLHGHKEQGCLRPAGMSAEQFLTLLSEYGLLTKQENEAFQNAYALLRYQGQQPPQTQWSLVENTIEAFSQRLESLSPSKRQLLQQQLLPPTPRYAPHLKKQPSSPPKQTPPRTTASTEPQASLLSTQPNPTKSLETSSMPQRAPSLSVQQWGALFLCVGGLFMGSGVVVGAVYANKIRCEARNWARWLGWHIPLPTHEQTYEEALAKQLQQTRLQEQQIRREIAQKPLKAGPWVNLADFAAAHHRYGDAILFYQRAIELNPQEVHALNNLAWLLCTSRDAYFRAPHKALKLAQRAFQLSKQPFVMDTLAEAHFQHGHLEQAIAIQKKALAKARALLKKRVKITGDLPHYQNQLRKFEYIFERKKRWKAKKKQSKTQTKIPNKMLLKRAHTPCPRIFPPPHYPRPQTQQKPDALLATSHTQAHPPQNLPHEKTKASEGKSRP